MILILSLTTGEDGVPDTNKGKTFFFTLLCHLNNFSYNTKTSTPMKRNKVLGHTTNDRLQVYLRRSHLTRAIQDNVIKTS